jgi:putative flippase GtrA
MRHILIQFRGRSNHGPLVQFIKYGIAGAAATAVHVFLFYLMASLLLPALSHGDVTAKLLGLPVTDVSDALRARNSIIDNFVAFLFSNLTAYLINICWVFERGRHHPVLEIAFFYAVSGLSVLIGSALMGFLIHRYGTTTTLAFGANVVVALMINYVMRKFVVFKG